MKSKINGCFRVSTGTKKMARIFALAAVIALVFAACDLFKEEEEPKYNGVFLKNGTQDEYEYSVEFYTGASWKEMKKEKIAVGETKFYDKGGYDDRHRILFSKDEKVIDKEIYIEKEPVKKKIIYVCNGTEIKLE